MSLPEIRRDLMRIGNRDRLTADRVSDLFQYADLIYSMPEMFLNGEPPPTPEELYTTWKMSYDEPA